jgi:PHS family inorganic phosphate transporter-like MFS transporter
MGIGIGGDYPLSAIITSEFSATKFRGRMMTAVMSAQGFGNFGQFHRAVVPSDQTESDVQKLPHLLV